ncbi:zinc-ribbon domain-containing protein [Zafaria sp. Z1313]|uniref:zinc-ribbon domain-containing protein n=1 Tax=Zafaria sp. Z1313 TaxID=3423202 RepID=UPI003D302ADF
MNFLLHPLSDAKLTQSPDSYPGTQPPSSTVAGSNKKQAWQCVHGHSFTATVANRALNGSGCPVCANLAVSAGINDLATTHPGLAAEWHPELNGDLRPEHVIGGRDAKIAWLCPAGHDYWKTVAKRKGGQGCPICSGRRVALGVNDLGTTHPALAAEWHFELNGDLGPVDVSAGSALTVHWICPAKHAYDTPIGNRTGAKKAGCPYCSNRKLLTGYNDLATQYPALALDWDPARNGGLTAAEVLPGSRLRSWKCAYGHEQEMMFRNRLRAGGCTGCPRDRRAASHPPAERKMPS